MKQNVYAVYDSKAHAYLQPFFTLNDATAKRSLAAAAADPTTLFSKFPGDYTLYRIGEYDDATGMIVAQQPAFNLGQALQEPQHDAQ